ncbi:MAG: EndoU domain-containing protein, partial [Terracidiphilus sp.]
MTEPAQKLTDRQEPRAPLQESARSYQSADDKVLRLQRAVGNRKVAELIRSRQISRDGTFVPIRPKLSVGATDDPHEREAEHVARQAVNTPEPTLKQVSPPVGLANPGRPKVQATDLISKSQHGPEKTKDPEKEIESNEDSIQRQANLDGNDSFDSNSGLKNRLNANRDNGGVLPAHIRTYMVPRFGLDFGGVRVHARVDSATPSVQRDGQTEDKDTASCSTCAAEQQNAVQRSPAVENLFAPTERSCAPEASTETTPFGCNGQPSARFSAMTPAPASTSAKLNTLTQPQPTPAPMAANISRLSEAPSRAPQIQRDWYNFDIPLTDYQFDPTPEGVKTAANLVKDTAVSGFDWIVDKIKSLVDSGKQWLSERWSSLEEFASSSFDTAKNAFANIVGLIKNPLNFLGDSLMNLDAQGLSKAWAAFSGLITTVADGFKATTDGLLGQVSKLWGGINGFATSLLNQVSSLTENFLFKKLPDTLQRLAFTVIDELKSLWKSINDGWSSLFNKIKAWVDGALDKVFGFVRKVASFGINVVIAGIVQFGQLVLFLKDLFSNPMKYVNILAERSVKAFDGVESRFVGIIGQYFGSTKAAEPPAGSSTTIQRAPAPAAAAETKNSASWGDIGHGVLEMMGKKWNEFKSDPMSIVTGLLMDMFLPIVGNVKDVIQLFKDIKKIVTGPLGAGSLEEFWTSLLQILDIPILIYKTVVSILMRSLMVPLIVATFIPHPLVKAIAAAVGEALLAAFVQGEGLNLTQKLLLLKTGATTQAQKEDAYNRIADSLIALAMTAVIIVVMLILHFIANVMKGIFNFVKGKVFRIEVAPVEGKGAEPKTEKPSDPNAKPSDKDPAKLKPGSTDKMIICRVCDIVPNVPADLMARRAKLSPEMRTYLDGEAGKIFPDPANPTPENFQTLRDFMEDAATKGGGDLESGLRNKAASASVGSVTAPIDFDGHITRAEIKPNGNVVGGHSTATGEVKVIPGTEAGRNPQGVYKAKIQVADPANPGRYLPKTNNLGYSTMFPDTWTPERIKVEV